MTVRPTRLGRTLFGYRPTHVRQFLLERDGLISQVEKQIQSARNSEADARAELATLRQALAQKDSELALVREAAEASPDGPSNDLSVEYLREEAHRIMEVTEEATRRIIHRTKENLDLQLERHQRLQGEIAAEMATLMVWRESAETLGDLASETRILIREVPNRLREALGPLDGAVISFDEKLDQLSHLPEPRSPRTTAPDRNGWIQSESLVEIADQGSETFYMPATPVPSAPTGDPPPRIPMETHGDS